MEAYLPRFLAEPQTILAAAIDLQLAIANYIDTPYQLLEFLVNSPEPDVASAARLHLTWAGEIEGDTERVIEDLLKTQQIGQNDRLAVELLKLGTVPPCFVSQWVPPAKIVERLDNPHMPLEYKIEFLERLAREDRLDIVVPVAGSIDTPPQLLARLIGSVHLAIRDTASNNPSCSAETIASIDREYEIAANWNTPPAQLAISATSHWEWIRLTVAQNPAISAETLMVLAQDEVARIRLAVANNPHAPAAVLQVLAENNHGEVRSLVAKHPHTSEETLHQLFTDCQNVLRSRSDLPLSILERFFNERDRRKALWEDSATREFLLRNSQTSTALLAELATDYLDEIRANRAALNPRNSEILGTWVLDATDYLARIVQHPNISIKTLTELASHYNPKVRLAVGMNQTTPEAIRFNILKQLGYYPIKHPTELDPEYSIVYDREIKLSIVKDINVPIVILTRMAENELRENQLKAGVQKILEAYYSRDEWNDTVNERIISNLKDKVLKPAGIEIDFVRWIEIIINEENLSLEDIKTKWQELLPQLPIGSIEQVIKSVTSFANDVRSELNRNPCWNAVVSALLENPQIPEILREKLWGQYQKLHQCYSYNGSGDIYLRLALCLNSMVPEVRQREYFQQVVESGYMNDFIATNPKIPPNMLTELMNKGGSIRQAIAKNPNAPHSVLLELSKDSNSTTRNWVAENPSTPLDILLTLTNDGALKNPSFPPLERYQVTLENNLVNERQQASTLIASLPLKTKLSLTQVVEGNELPAKLAIAQDPQTSIEILERLAQDSNENVRSTVAANPNLPLATLLKLADDLGRNVKLQLVCQQFNRSTPVEILTKLADDPDSNIKMYIARNASTPPEVLAQLAFTDDPGGKIADSLTKNQNTSVETLEYLGVERHAVNAYNPKTPPNALAAQVNYAFTQHPQGRDNILNSLLRNYESQMPVSSLEKLVKHNEHLGDIARHQNTPAAILEELSNSSEILILWGLAKNPNSSPTLLEKLLRENYETVAGHMVERKVIPLNVIGRLLDNTSEPIRRFIVVKDNLPLDLADRVISTETHDSVLISLARNPILTSELISKFIQQHGLKPDICIALLLQPNLTTEHWQQLATSQFEAVRLAIASRQNIPIDILVILSDDRELQVRMAIASNLQTPSDLLIKLAADLEAEVRTRIAANPQTPIPTLETLAADASVEVRRSVLNNPQTPASVRQDLEDIFGRKPIATTIDTLRDLPRIYDPANDDVVTILTEYARSNNNFVRLVSLLHPLMPVEVIERAARSPYWSDRYAVAKNPNTPDSLRQNLARDSNRIVSAINRIVASQV